MKLINGLLLVFAVCLFSSCYLARAYKFRKFNLQDHEKLASVTIPKSDSPYRFIQPAAGNYTGLGNFLDSNLAGTQTAAFLVIRNDSIIYERYFNGFDTLSKLPSFSVAKSFVGTLVAIAISEGYIKSTAEPITNYLPDLLKTDTGYAHITIQQVLDMRTNLKFTERYNSPTSDVIQLGFKNNMRKKMLQTGLDNGNGDFEYQSLNTQILSFILEKATGRKTEDYLRQKLWEPLGMESDATWNTDGRDEVRAFCCLNATARDFAKLGVLYLKNGWWNGRQLIPTQWVNSITNRDSIQGYRYKNQWWLSRTGSTYFAQGVLNQQVYVDPSKNLVIVRLGHRWTYPSYINRFINGLQEKL
ncbi:serine hydrolase domain-containing protein [Foetidibacter luteolus]|uniref:serine hydrolase domain-containing protein n=1 Tax=Foetidibacter luteolus TaxID=2608880 RepID=UPI00129BC158|nr:serine hydrolase [Foetidibacter luteolus]